MKIIGHRGARGLAPENTLPSFQKALEHHADQLELDLRVTADGVVVLNHDRFIRWASGKKSTIREHSYRYLQQHKSDILTLPEFFDAIPHSVSLLIEIKPHVNLEPIIELLHAETIAGRPAKAMSIASFDQAILRRMHNVFPKLPMVVNERWSGVIGAWRAQEVGTKRLNMRSWWLWRGFLRSMHQRGYQIAPYTINSPAQARRWQPYIYGIITDRPDLFE
jgi:glycerophosphoryl diester phosphodiesterase